MNKFIRAARTSQSLSLAAMEEASRFGLREADIEHLFLALVISEQSAGLALRGLGIDLESARGAVEVQHEEQLASLGIDAPFPSGGRIVFHETNGYAWTERAADVIAESGGRGKTGDAAAVLRELTAEPSGLISGILRRLGTTPEAVVGQLDRLGPSDAAVPALTSAQEGDRTSASVETFVTAPREQVWELLSDPLRIPEWEPTIGRVERSAPGETTDAAWEGTATANRPDGRTITVKPRFRRRSIELIAAHPGGITWRFGFPDAPHSNPVLTEFTVETTVGGTQVRILRFWSRRRGWRSIVAFPLRPLQELLVWISLFQTGGSISRAFR